MSCPPKTSWKIPILHHRIQQNIKTTSQPNNKIRLKTRIVCSSISFSVRKLYNKLRLEAYTERSESNPGRSLGIINASRKAVWKTVPKQTSNINKKKISLSVFPLFLSIDVLYHCSKFITDSTDATDFIFSRISFSLGFVSDFIAPNGAGLLQAKEKSVKIQCVLAHKNPL